MPFFEVPKDEDLSPEALRLFEEYRRVRGGDVGRSWRVFGRSQRIFETRLRAYENLSDQCPFSWEARSVAVMLIAHAKRCQTCFMGARRELDKLGFDEEQLDTMCAHPETLPLKEGDRLFVRYTLKIATSSADLTPKDFREMEASGFSKDQIQAMIAFAAYWNMNMVFNQAALAGLTEE
jgi:alkylhydroperoxidase family enzyme